MTPSLRACTYHISNQPCWRGMEWWWQWRLIPRRRGFEKVEGQLFALTLSYPPRYVLMVDISSCAPISKLQADRPLSARWLTDEFNQSATAYNHASLDSKQSVNKVRGRFVFENNGNALRGCADRAVGSNSRGIVYFDCLRSTAICSSARG